MPTLERAGPGHLSARWTGTGPTQSSITPPGWTSEVAEGTRTASLADEPTFYILGVKILESNNFGQHKIINAGVLWGVLEHPPPADAVPHVSPTVALTSRHDPRF